MRIRTLPVAHPEQLVEVRICRSGGKAAGFGQFRRRPSLTNLLWEHVRDRQEAFSTSSPGAPTDFDLTTGGEARYANGLWVSGDFFTTLGVPAIIGRMLTAADDRRGCAAPPAVLGYGFWQREYGGSPSAVGRQIMLDGHAYDIVGVTPASFFGVEVGRAFDVAVPLCAEPFTRGARSRSTKDVWFLGAMGRLKPGVTLEQARAHLAAISAPIFQATLPPRYGADDAKRYLAFKLGAFPGGTGVSVLRRDYESPLWLLLATTGAGAADRLREPGEPDAGARDRARARDRRAPRDRRVARAHRPPAARREPADCRGGRRRRARCWRSGCRASWSPLSYHEATA